MRDVNVEEMIEILDDPGRRLGWKGTPAGPETEQQVREWAFGLFAGWETERQVTHLLAVGIEEAADILVMATEPDREALLSLLPEDFRAGIEAFLPLPTA